MKLYNVMIEANFKASYEGEINRNYSRLVFAETKQQAIDFVNDGLSSLRNISYLYEKACEAYEVDSTKAKRKRKTQYYIS